MNEFDGRKINRKALEEISIRAVSRVEAGESPEVVTKVLGLTRPHIYVSVKQTPSFSELHSMSLSRVSHITQAPSGDYNSLKF